MLWGVVDFRVDIRYLGVALGQASLPDFYLPPVSILLFRLCVPFETNPVEREPVCVLCLTVGITLLGSHSVVVL